MGHIFCTKCRSKLDVQELKDDAWDAPKARSDNGRGWRLVSVAVLACFAFCAALAVWPIPIEGHKTSAADAQQARKKIVLLEKGLSPASQILTERELNAYLGLLLANVRPPRTLGFWTTTIKSVDMAIRPNAVTFSTESTWGPQTIGSLRMGPWSVTHQVTVAPVARMRGVAPNDAGFDWAIKGGRIGHLPLPGPLSAPLTSALRPLLAASVRERNLLAVITRLELEDGRITVAVKKTK